MSLRSIWKRLRGQHDQHDGVPSVGNSLALGSAELYELLAGSPAASGMAVNES